MDDLLKEKVFVETSPSGDEMRVTGALSRPLIVEGEVPNRVPDVSLKDKAEVLVVKDEPPVVPLDPVELRRAVIAEHLAKPTTSYVHPVDPDTLLVRNGYGNPVTPRRYNTPDGWALIQDTDDRGKPRGLHFLVKARSHGTCQGKGYNEQRVVGRPAQIPCVCTNSRLHRYLEELQAVPAVAADGLPVKQPIQKDAYVGKLKAIQRNETDLREIYAKRELLREPIRQELSSLDAKIAPLRAATTDCHQRKQLEIAEEEMRLNEAIKLNLQTHAESNHLAQSLREEIAKLQNALINAVQRIENSKNQAETHSVELARLYARRDLAIQNELSDIQVQIEALEGERRATDERLMGVDGYKQSLASRLEHHNEVLRSRIPKDRLDD